MSTVRHKATEQEDAALLGAVGLIQRVRELSRPAYLTVIIGLALVTFGLGFGSLYLTPPGSNAAIWWPAIGTGAVLYLLYRGPRWQVLVLIGAVGAASNLLIGRPPIFALWSFVILLTELALFVAILGPQGRSAMLGTVRGMLRFFTAVIAASLLVGVFAALAFVILVGANPVETFSALVPSHLSALLLIVPVALVPLPRQAEGTRLELVLLLCGLIVGTVYLLAQVQALPIGALLFPLFAWAAVRFRPIVVTVQLAVFGGIASVFTALGGVSFAASVDSDSSVLVVQLYLVSLALTTQSITVVGSERAEQRAENQRRAGILLGGFVGSQVGSLFVRTERNARPSILEINGVAASLADRAWLDPLIDTWATSGHDDLSTEVQLENGHTVQVYGRRVLTADGETVLGLQLVDITDFVSAQREMARAVEQGRRVAEEMRALSQQKDDFVSAVSHELRTPITSIVGFVEELHDTATDDQRQATEIILRNATRLTGMVEELLELGRMTAPNPVRENHPIDLAVVIREAIEDQSASAAARQITVSAALCSDPALVMSNNNAVARIVTNLLSNAIKFTPDNGQVEISSARGDGTVTLLIDDSGPGISEDDQPRVFERFYRSADPEKRQTPGTGLGLSIVKSLVELLGGRIGISRSPLGGARMTVTMPLAVHLQSDPSVAARVAD